MANVSFKQGNFSEAQLKGLDQGTIAITLDEKALYVKTTSDATTLPIRIGQIVTYDTLADFRSALKDKNNPPFSTEGFYYITGENALLKYVKTGGNYTDADEDNTTSFSGFWKQINTDTVTDLSSINDSINILNTGLSSANAEITTNTQNIATNAANIETNTKNIAANGAEIAKKADASTVTDLTNTVNNLSTQHTEDKVVLEGAIADVKKTADTNTSGLATLNETVTNLSDTVSSNKSDIEGQLATAQSTLQGNIDAKVAQSDYDTKVAELEAKDTTLNNAISTLETKIGNVENVMHFLGTCKADTVTEISTAYPSPDSGDVVAVTGGELNGREYVWNKASWEEIGYTEGVSSAINSLSGQIDALNSTVSAKVDQSVYDARVAAVNTSIKDLQDNKVDQSDYDIKIQALEDKDGELTSTLANKADTTTVNAALAGKVDTTDFETLKSTVDNHTTAINGVDNKITTAINSALEWGTF